jgi:hypothetical protein
MTFILGIFYYIIGFIMAIFWSAAIAFLLCFPIALFRMFRHRRNILLSLMYLGGAIVCAAAFFGLERLTNMVANNTNHAAYLFLFVGMGFPGLWALTIIPKYVRVALRQTSGVEDPGDVDES